MICKSCGKELENDYKACPYCGAKTEERISGEKVCPYCGKLVKGDFKICPYCENKIEIISQKNGVVCLILLFSFILFPPLIWSHRFYAGKITLIHYNVSYFYIFTIFGCRFGNCYIVYYRFNHWCNFAYNFYKRFYTNYKW
ncbi:zinc ribbon domain-containing protein [Brachyspira aalborgi]|uniref:Zinc ribbon domain-containing protein n=1 Tax=Brachyspira aalborgi TaxID=29522 RepID=A0A5C8GGS7_9SPIR|nr:zinc ribbon domain-containing protein [Brachyspira aalborgi]